MTNSPLNMLPQFDPTWSNEFKKKWLDLYLSIVKMATPDKPKEK